MMPTLSEVSHALYGAFRLAHLDRSGLAFFDPTAEGCRRSFAAALIVYPIFLLMLPIGATDEQWRSGFGCLVLSQSIAYVADWAALPLIVISVARRVGREAEAIGFVTVYNWSQVLQAVFLLATTGIAGSGMLPPAATMTLMLAAQIAVLAYQWFIARTAFNAAGFAATAIVLLASVLNVVFVNVALRVC
jgi:hypothetical protein